MERIDKAGEAGNGLAWRSTVQSSDDKAGAAGEYNDGDARPKFSHLS